MKKNTKKTEVYDFDESSESQNSILSVIKNKKNSLDCKPIFLNLIKKIPNALLEFLRLEIINGNIVTTISCSNWPHEGSIVVNLKYRFKTAKNINQPELEFLILNDIHYWMEQVKQTVNGTDYLLIT